MEYALTIMQLAPWLTPPNYLAAMQSGTNLGLNLAQMDAQQQEAAERLASAREEMAQRLQISFAERAMQEQRYKESLDQRREAAQERLQAAKLLANYRRDTLKFRQTQADKTAQPIFDPANRQVIGWQGANIHFLPEPGQKKFPPEKQAEIDFLKRNINDDELIKRTLLSQIRRQGFYTTDSMRELRKLGETIQGNDDKLLKLIQADSSTSPPAIPILPPQSGLTNASPATPAAQQGEIEMLVRGRRAIYNAVTQEFIRYASPTYP